MSFVNRHIILPDDFIIAVGFGTAELLHNNEVVYEEKIGETDIAIDGGMTVLEAKKIARQSPKDSWKIHMSEPFGDGFYQYINGEFVIYKKGPGFA